VSSLDLEKNREDKCGSSGSNVEREEGQALRVSIDGASGAWDLGTVCFTRGPTRSGTQLTPGRP
jgi:hypothetical protein